MYGELQRGPRWLAGIGWFAELATVVCFYFLATTLADHWGTDAAPSLMVGLIVGTLVLAPAGLVLVQNTALVRVGNGSVSGYLLPFRMFRIRAERIDVVRRTEDVSGKNVAGLGYRSAGGRRYLLLDAGPAVEIRTHDGRVFVLRTDDPEAMIKAVEAECLAARVRNPEESRTR